MDGAIGRRRREHHGLQDRGLNQWNQLEQPGGQHRFHQHQLLAHGLTAGSTRHYRVSAINSEGTGPASGTDSATTDSAPAQATTCTVNLVVSAGESCTYPGRSDEFSVDSSGTASFLIFSAGENLEVRNITINGVEYTLVASKQSDGTWKIEEVG